MKINKNDRQSQQSDSKSKEQLTENNLPSPQDKLTIIMDTEEREEEVVSFQRRPQYRFHENNRRRF